MKYYELEMDERVRVKEMIEKIIGTKSECITDRMSNSDRIKARFAYDKLFEELANVWCKYGDKALAMHYTDKGGIKEGVTPSGKKWVFYMNSFGWTQRSHHCGSLYIEGKGCIFTSGKLARAIERIMEE